ncbi:Uncharacterised protein [Vibrio cholerae]|uniref:Uncharacterized protein n=1 Tax=Vibrio cholerae TaxID=666 RepID=A0A655UMP1_VIBCL|nr:Uncharacterised protein [Vibrio cholerae]CSB98153.1 Uncharacterised protein [Vibrio cholerae]CSC71234.1 Uncharacterised protein [Vibrio cholerae]
MREATTILLEAFFDPFRHLSTDGDQLNLHT